MSDSSKLTIEATAVSSTVSSIMPHKSSVAANHMISGDLVDTRYTQDWALADAHLPAGGHIPRQHSPKLPGPHTLPPVQRKSVC